MKKKITKKNTRIEVQSDDPFKDCPTLPSSSVDYGNATINALKRANLDKQADIS